jgi:hypothetical protein
MSIPTTKVLHHTNLQACSFLDRPCLHLNLTNKRQRLHSPLNSPTLDTLEGIPLNSVPSLKIVPQLQTPQMRHRLDNLQIRCSWMDTEIF